MPRVMARTYAAVVPLYGACGLLGYYAYGDFANANINVNFPPNGPNLASILVQMVQELYFLYSTNLVLHLAVELHQYSNWTHFAFCSARTLKQA